MLVLYLELLIKKLINFYIALTLMCESKAIVYLVAAWKNDSFCSLNPVMRCKRDNPSAL